VIPGGPDAEPLSGGNVATAVVRVGDTVRKQAGPQTPAVHALLEHLREVGLRGAPRSFGVDDDGRHVLEWVAGWEPPADAVWATPIPPDGAEHVVHHDLAPWNLVVAEDRVVLVDWDTAGPGTRVWDLAWLALGLVPLRPTTPDDVVAARLRALADGYGLDEAGRARLAATVAPRAWSMHDLLAHGALTGEQPWARLWDEGHGGFWRRDAEWAERRADLLEAALLGG
jgi:hypothetical protein